MDNHQVEVAVITVPFPGQGHLNQLLQISSLISSYGLPVHYVAAAIHIRQARARLNISQIHFHDLPIPPFASPLPDPNSSSRFPSHLTDAWTASLPLAAFLNDIAGKYRRVVVVHDSMMAAVVQDVSSIPNAESYSLWCISAYSLISYLSKSHVQALEQDDVPKEIQHLSVSQFDPLKFRSGDLYNTCRLMEEPYLDILEREGPIGKRKSWAIGPILPPPDNQSRGNHKTLEWLDNQDPNSVI